MEGKSILLQKYTQGKQNSCTVKTEGKTQFYKQKFIACTEKLETWFSTIKLVRKYL